MLQYTAANLGDAESAFNAGLVLSRTGHPQEALARFEQAAAADVPAGRSAGRFKEGHAPVAGVEDGPDSGVQR